MAKTGMSDKIVENQTKVISDLKVELLKLNKTILGVGDDMYDHLGNIDQIAGDLNQTTKSISSYSDTAKTISQYLGMEEGSTRQMENYLAEMVHNDANLQIALKKGDNDDVKNQMVDQMTKVLENMEFSSEQDKRNYELMLDNIKNNSIESLDWEKIMEKGSSAFFPLTQKFMQGAELMRSTVVEKFPIAMKFLSADMVEHYKQGMQAIGGMLKSQFSTVLAPLEAITGPFMAVIKGGYMLTKTLMTKSNDYEKEAAKYSKKTYEVLAKDSAREKKEKMLEKPETKGIMKYLWPVVALFVGFFSGLVSSLEIYWKPIESFFLKTSKSFKSSGRIGKLFTSVGKFFGNISKGFVKLQKMIPKTFMTKLLGGVGKIFGRFLMPILMVWEAIKGWSKGENLRDKILGAASGILSVLFELPEMAFNAVMALFGSGFRLDLGADKIMAAVNGITDWFYINVTEPFLDWILIDIPDMFNEFIDSMSTFFGKIAGLGAWIKDAIIDLAISKLSGIPFVGKYVESLSKYKSKPEEGSTPSKSSQSNLDVEITKPVSPKLDDKVLERAKAYAVKEQIKGSSDTINALNTTNKNLSETNSTNKEIINNQQNFNVISTQNESDIPTEPENMGVMLFSKTWGLS